VTITHHLSVNNTALTGDEGTSVFLITGRVFGDDDDSAALVRGHDSAHSIDVFRAEVLELEADEGGEFPELDEDGDPSHFIINVDYVGELI